MGGCCARPNTQIETSKQRPIQEVKLRSSAYIDDDKPWFKITVQPKTKITLHEHELFCMASTDDDAWMCNGLELFKTGCYGGINDYGQTGGVQGWSCPIEKCDFDICKTCVQYTIWAEQER